MIEFQPEIKLTMDIKRDIDNLSLYEMKQLWQHGLDGCALFTGEVGEYFVKVMTIKQSYENEIYFNPKGL